MRIPNELEGARLNVMQTAELLSMDPGHMRRLVKRGVFPSPKRTAKNMPYFDFELLTKIGQILKSGIGSSGEEIAFYRRKPKQNKRQTNQPRRRPDAQKDDYIESIIEGCKQLGIEDEQLKPSCIAEVLTAEFGNDRPPLEQAIPKVARRIIGGD